METASLLIIAAGVLAFGLVSGRLRDSIVTAPMAFVVLGLAAGGHGLGLIDVELGHGFVHFLAELTLILVLFTDATRIDLGLLRREHIIPVRLLTLGMPLTIALGMLAATLLFPTFTLWEAALLAAVLAPTDAALGQAVVTSELIPVRIRQALNVESGLNDGIVLPLVLLFMSACSAAVAGGNDAAYWLKLGALQVTLGPLAGILIGRFGARALARAAERDWVDHAFLRLGGLGLAVLAFAVAETVHGNGFIAAFVAGLTFGNSARELSEHMHDFAEAEGQLLTLLVFLIFGAVMVPEALATIGWQAFLYAALSLTVLRMVPAALALIGVPLRLDTVLFVGWFGPRGLASILFGLLVVERSILVEREMILAVVIATVLLSVFAHGVTAAPAARWYHRRLAAGDADCEHRPVLAMPTRLHRR